MTNRFPPLSWCARVCALTFVYLLTLALGATIAADDRLLVGVAEVDITPPNGFPMAGYYHERLATGTIDPLKAKAIVFRGSNEQAAMVVCDLTAVSIDLTTEVRRLAAEKTGIAPQKIAIAGTHSHTAPDYSKHLYQYLGKELKHADGKQPYAEKLVGGIVDAIVRAHGSAGPMLVERGSAVQKTPVSFNRRFVMRDGSQQTWKSLDDPNVVRAAGPIDPEIGILAFRAADGDKPHAVLSNFALHLDTVGGMLWSADYPYFIEQTLRESLGDDVISVFGNGCCGDINHVDPTKKERNKTAYIGKSLGSTIQQGLGSLTPIKRSELQCRSTVVPLPLKPAMPAQVERAITTLAMINKGEKVEFLDQVAAYRTLIVDQLRNPAPREDATALLGWGLSRNWAGIGDTLPVEVQTMSLGDEVAIVFLPGEIFVDLGLAIKRSSPFPTTLVIELSNSVETAYVPTRAAAAGGSYEVTNSTVEPGAGEMLVEAAIRLLRESAAALANGKD